jgi:hypothetical protein
MKILFLCHRLPYPPKRGGKIRPFNMIRHLARRHRVTVATIARSAEELAEGQPLREYCEALHVGQISAIAGWSRFGLAWGTGYPATFGYFYSAPLARTVRTLLAECGFEAILVHSSSMGPYVAGHEGCRKVMDFGDADSEKWLEYSRSAPFPISVGFRLEGNKVRHYEKWLASRFDACSVTAPREGEILASYIQAPVHVFPNGVDLEYFGPKAASGQRYDPRRIVFTGNMSYKPNVEAVRSFVGTILPRIWSERPATQFYIVGMDPVPAVRRLADGDRVVVTGRVDDVRPFLDSAAVAVAPLRVARGLQNKVLEAMAMRVPVVASPAAFNGVHAVADRDLLVAADADAFGRGVLSLLGDAANRERYAAAGRACVERNHNWDRLLPRLEELVVGGAPGMDDEQPSVASRPYEVR